MNHDIDDIPRFDEPAREREWLAQESAMRRERLHLDPAGDDARSRRYRLLARALRTETEVGLPADFATQVSERIAATMNEKPPAMAFERGLTVALLASLLLAAGMVTLLYGASWWPTFHRLLPAPETMRWLLALLGCLGLHGVLGAWARRASAPH